MAEHRVIIKQFPELELQFKDVEFEIRSDDELEGYLGISKGTLSYQPAHGARRHIDWEQLSKLSETWETW
ncbi:uncharacterized protein METZ01_LOCUS254053 [marine metagenome]|uniref:Uncharacterized protein n=1 Tax=marine metagenome TaxID=408172 RepID=A0A382IPL5_9ZZZZ